MLLHAPYLLVCKRSDFIYLLFILCSSFFFFLTLSFSGGFCLIHVHVTLSTYLLGPPVGMDWTEDVLFLCPTEQDSGSVTFSTECTFNFSTQKKKIMEGDNQSASIDYLAIYLLNCILSLLFFFFLDNLNCSWYNNHKQKERSPITMMISLNNFYCSSRFLFFLLDLRLLFGPRIFKKEKLTWQSHMSMGCFSNTVVGLEGQS